MCLLNFSLDRIAFLHSGRPSIWFWILNTYSIRFFAEPISHDTTRPRSINSRRKTFLRSRKRIDTNTKSNTCIFARVQEGNNVYDRNTFITTVNTCICDSIFKYFSLYFSFNLSRVLESSLIWIIIIYKESSLYTNFDENFKNQVF